MSELAPSTILTGYSNDNEAVHHVVFVHTKLRQRQEDRYLADVALALQNTGHLVTIYTSQLNENNALDLVHPSKGPLCVLTAGGWIPNSLCGAFKRAMIRLKASWIIWNLILFPPRPKPKIVILDTDAIALLILHYFSKYKSIYIQHFPHIQCSNYFHCSMQITTDLLTAKSINYADEIIVQTRCLQEIFARSFPKRQKQSLVFHPCYDTGLWLENSIDIRRIVPDLPKDYKLFVTLGDYRKRCNIQLVLDALEHMFSFMGNPIKDQIHLVVAGKCSERSSEQKQYYEQLIESTKEKTYASQVTFLKQLPTIHQKTLLENCTAVVHPTRHELYPGPILAAMKLGKPIIAVNCGFASLVITHRVSGILVEPDPYKLALVMHKLITSTNLQLFLGSMAREQYQSNFSFSVFAKNLNELVLRQIKNIPEVCDKK